jgi:hypothetical protein
MLLLEPYTGCPKILYFKHFYLIFSWLLNNVLHTTLFREFWGTQYFAYLYVEFSDFYVNQSLAGQTILDTDSFAMHANNESHMFTLYFASKIYIYT